MDNYMNAENTATKIWEQYQDGLQYQKKMGFSDDFPIFVRFREGDQWPAATQRTKNFPRPVFNIVDMFIKNKKAGITNTNLSINYEPLTAVDNDMAQAGAQAYTDYSKTVWENLDQDALNKELVDDSLLLGTGVLHYFWDVSKNELGGETIDPLQVIFANPQIKKVQKQDWIIISTNMTVKAARELAESNKVSTTKIALINPENIEENYSSEKFDVEDEKITVLVKYFRENGEVYFIKSTSAVIIQDKTPLTPETAQYKMQLYPITVLTNRPRKKSIFGIGEAQDIITINKLYNQMRGMMAFNVILMANPALLVKPNALGEQKITNAGGQIIIDYYKGGGDGIKYMQPAPLTNMINQFADEILNSARTIYGVTDVSTGELDKSQMAAQAIIALQNQAKLPVKEQQENYFSTIKEIGDIWVEFYKAYYSTIRTIAVERNGQTERESFIGTDYANVDFKVKVNVGISTDQESLVVSELESLKAAGDITKEQYVELMPAKLMPFKEDLKDIWEQAKQDENEQLKQMVTQLQAQLSELQGGQAQMAQQLEQDKGVIEKLTSDDAELDRQAKRVSLAKQLIS